jgi:hypothetical protein
MISRLISSIWVVSQWNYTTKTALLKNVITGQNEVRTHGRYLTTLYQHLQLLDSRSVYLPWHDKLNQGGRSITLQEWNALKRWLKSLVETTKTEHKARSACSQRYRTNRTRDREVTTAAPSVSVRNSPVGQCTTYCTYLPTGVSRLIYTDELLIYRPNLRYGSIWV